MHHELAPGEPKRRHVRQATRSGASLLAVATGVLIPSPGWAQGNASAPRPVQEQLQCERALREQQEGLVDERARTASPNPTARLPELEQPYFRIDRLVLVGEQSTHFQRLLEEANGRSAGLSDSPVGLCLGTEGINIVISRLQQALVASGWTTTRVLAAPQDLSTRTLTLVPGRLDQLRFVDDPRDLTTLRAAIPTQSGDLINLRDVEEGLENLKRLPTAEAGIQVAPASDPDSSAGDSDLLVTYRRAFPLRVTLSLDDGGTLSTTASRSTYHQTAAGLDQDYVLGRDQQPGSARFARGSPGCDQQDRRIPSRFSVRQQQRGQRCGGRSAAPARRRVGAGRQSSPALRERHARRQSRLIGVAQAPSDLFRRPRRPSTEARRVCAFSLLT